MPIRISLEVAERLEELKAESGKSYNQLIEDALVKCYCNPPQATPTTGADLEPLLRRLDAIESRLGSKDDITSNITSDITDDIKSGITDDIKSDISYDIKSDIKSDMEPEPEPTPEPTILTKQELAERLGSKVSGGAMSALTALATAKKPVAWTSKYDPEGLGWKPTDGSREQWVVDSQP